MLIGNIVLLLLAIVVLAYRETKVIIWTAIFATVLALVSIFGDLPFLLLSLFWLLFIAVVIFANATQLRQRYFSSRVMAILRKELPPISQTEREAIESGNTWWEKDLLSGRPDWKKFLDLPKPSLTQAEQDFLNSQVETLCAMLDDWKIVETSDLPKSVWDYLKQEKFFGMVIPKEYGGLGFSALAHSTVVMKVATRSLSAAVNMMVPNSLGPGELLLHYGTDEQKKHYLPRLASGLEVPCFALTSPNAGSDAGSMVDSGIVCQGEYQGQKTLGIRLNWDKRYITLAPVATVLGLAFHMYDPDHLLSDKTDVGITVCLIPTSHPGVETGKRHLPMHLAFMNGPTRGKDVFIPLDWIIGGKAMAGRGWRMLMEDLSIGRAISLPALSTGCGKLAYRLTGAYSRVRSQFHTSIANFEGVAEALASIAGNTYLLEATRTLTTGAVDQKIRPAIASAIAKYHMTELSRQVINHAMDIHGGHGIQMGPNNCLAHAYMAAPISITVEGANILTRNLIIFGQGVIRCHPYLLQEMTVLQSKDANAVAELDKLLMQHIGYFISNAARSLVSGLTGGLLLRAPVLGYAAKYYRQLARMSCALAFLVDVMLLTLGGNLKRKERVSARLGDVLSQLYMATAVLKYAQEHGETPTDKNYLQWTLQSCLHKIQIAIDGLINNYPYRWLRWLLRLFIFPFGKVYKAPNDKLDQLIVSAMLEPSEFRDRLTQYCYSSKNMHDATGRIENALQKIIAAAPAAEKIHNAVRDGAVPRTAKTEERAQLALKAGIVTQQEIVLLQEAARAQQEAIKVDEFSFDLSKVD